jgi:hypothetical protein
VGKVVAIAAMVPVMGTGVTATSQQKYKILITSEHQDFGYDKKVNLPTREMMPV